MSELEIAVAVYVAYLFGSLSSAVIVCKMMGLPDPRTIGSKNPGATNVLRVGGKKAAIITLIGDMLKGMIPVAGSILYGFDPVVVTLVAFAAFLGHLYPIFFSFEGGKGVATALGAILVASWPVGLAALFTWILVAFIFRYSSVASLCMATLLPFFMGYFTGNIHQVLIVALLSLMLVFKHKSNILNLLKGKESKLFAKKL